MTRAGRPEVIIAGAGLAGIACAVRLAERGVSVLLLETRKRLGGRAASFLDRRSGLEIDNCQHVALGCCTAYRDLLNRIGAGGALRWTSEQWWVEPGGRVSTLKPSGLPAPLHAGPSFAAARFLSFQEKASVARALAAIRFADRTRWRGRTFGEFLRAHKQPDRAIARFWEPVIVSACNLSVHRVAAEPALKVFQDGLLRSPEAGFVGVPRVPLTRLYEEVPRLLEGAGGEVRFGASVRAIDTRTVTLADGEMIEADRLVCALPVERLCALSRGSCAGDPRVRALRDAEFSPILGVHLVFDRPVLATPHAVLLDTGTQWIFRKDDAGKVLHAVVSAADDWVPLTEQEIVRRVVEDIRLCYPGAKPARVVAARAVKEKRATFAATPAFERVRPEVAGGSGLVLAGDYVRTGWPATMEGATRAGEMAARAVLEGVA